MIRILSLLGILGGLVYVLIAWATSGPEINAGTDTPRDTQRKNGATSPGGIDGKKENGNPGAPRPRALGAATAHPVENKGTGLHQPLVVPDTRVTIIDRQDVSPERPGKLMFLGVEVGKDAKMNERDKFTAKTYFVAKIVSPEELAAKPDTATFKIQGDARTWKRWDPDVENAEPGKMKLVAEERTFARLKEGTPVQKGQLLGMVNPELAQKEIATKIDKLEVSQFALTASTKTKEEAYERWDRMERNLRGFSDEERRGAKLTYQRYVEEEKTKVAEINVARNELSQTLSVLKHHELRAATDGVVKVVSKHPGELIKEQDQILQIQNPDALKLEGFVEVQEIRKLALGSVVVVEPKQPDAPRAILGGHTERVNGVAVTRGAKPLIISVGEDRTARVWAVKSEQVPGTNKETWFGEELWTLEHPAAVRSVACSPAKAAHNLCVTGTVDGVGRVWNLDELGKKKPIELAAQHSGPIRAIAFSPDGERIATGGEDKTIRLWDTEGKLLKSIDAHGGGVTSLQFIGAGRLVSAGLDKRIVVWKLEGDELTNEKDFDQRSGQVPVLGVSADGKQVLFDQDKQLRVRSLEDRSTRAVITNSPSTIDFTTFALFSPDDKSVLTVSEADNRLQLWRNPVTSPRGRAAELRQYIWNDAPMTCGAFAPEAPFAVTGTRDRQVLVWRLPTEAELNAPETTATITNIERFLDSSSRQVRVVAEVNAKNEGLLPGSTATMVIYPTK